MGSVLDATPAVQAVPTYGWLVANFGNNISPDFEKLNVHYSPDGKYVAAGVNNPVYTPASTVTGGLRDPSIKKVNGRWYCAHTVNNGANFTYEIAVSDDLVNWSLSTTMGVGGAPPTLTKGTTATTGGTFAAGAFYWKATWVNAWGESLGSTEVSATLVASGTQAFTVNTPPTGATQWKLYRGTAAGAENVLVTTVAAGTLTYTDTGTAGTAASVPTTDTTGWIPNLLYAWAPELVQDTDGSWVVLFTAVLSTSGNPHDIYWMRSYDSVLSSWTVPTKVAWTGSSNGGAPIDPTAVYANSQWHIFYGNNGSIQRATATTLTGTWNTDQTGNWANWYTDTPANSTIHYEGPEIVQVNSTTWRLYCDQYTGTTSPYTTVGYWWSETSDFLAWTPMKQAVRGPGYPDGYALRHGTWLPLLTESDQNTVLAASSGGGPKPIYHAEFTGSGTTTAGTPWSGTLVKDAAKSSAQAPNFVSVTGRVLKILQNGLYSVHFVAPYSTTIALGGGYMAIKGPSGVPVYASTDIVSSAAAQSIDNSNMWLINGDTLEFLISANNAMPSGFNLRVRITKIA